MNFNYNNFKRVKKHQVRAQESMKLPPPIQLPINN